MFALLTTLIIITAILLVLVILIQNPKSGGLSSQFGGAQTQQFMGAKQANNFLEKVTWSLTSIMVFLVLSTSFLLKKRHTHHRQIISPNLAKAKKNTNQKKIDKTTKVDETQTTSTATTTNDKNITSNK